MYHSSLVRNKTTSKLRKQASTILLAANNLPASPIRHQLSTTPPPAPQHLIPTPHTRQKPDTKTRRNLIKRH